ncbi:hypothetical protein RchiOBHm_Chr6g0305111 [Rosa chinensis]|uniref:Uncharacterized protein n=1 Tax=Rosa chinensis TaxID=74649 RepID=A0A2P6PZU3_ROSCH|nr:hypothetical protein RchiOBHm_Chr6g0305111 [Rosa chinensis]
MGLLLMQPQLQLNLQRPSSLENQSSMRLLLMRSQLQLNLQHRLRSVTEKLSLL